MKVLTISLSMLALAAFVTGCPQPPQPVTPRVQVQSSDNPTLAQAGSGISYSEARKEFQTKLIRRGPAPQNAPKLTVPPEVAVVTYESDGRTLKAWVSKAALTKGAPKPAVLFLHGGFAFGEDDWEQTLPLRDAGFHVMVPLLRGENGQSGHFTLHIGETDDAVAAGQLLASMPGVDSRNLFVSGHSIGETLAMFVALASDRYRAAAPISGAPDCENHLEDQTELAPFDLTNPRELEMRSPMKFAAHFRCPVRCYYGTNEHPMFDTDSRAMADAATAAGKDVKAVRLPGNHGTVVEPALAAATLFFREHMMK